MNRYLTPFPNMGYNKDEKKDRVELTRRCQKSLTRVPKMVVATLMLWKMEVEKKGIFEVQAISTYRDHSLSGKLKGTGIRSISLSYGYRAYYRIQKEEIILVTVEDVNYHDYQAIERLFGR
ncbi:MAG: hypothetical protein HY072_10565 [Deltaproteobacteria bacterium]|nr:hypothetical protein [Deltaproteobacteria bacterium]